MANIIILGAGVMGSALAVPLADRGHKVRLIGTHLDDDIIAAIRRHDIHARLKVHLPDSVLPGSHDELAGAVGGAELLVLGVSSAGVDWAAGKLTSVLPPDVPIVMVTKGLAGDGETIQTLPEYLEKRLGATYRGDVCAIGGPSIASELAVRRPTCVTLAGRSGPAAHRLAEWFRTPYYHVWPDTNLVGVEVCAALKNLYALGVGMAAGMLESAPAVENESGMHNMAAALFAEAVWEMSYMVTALGGDPQAVWTLAGGGDLYVTCQAGRNSRMGRWLGKGMRYSEAKLRYMPEDVVEGAETALAIRASLSAMISRGELDRNSLPMLCAIVEAVCDDACRPIPLERFFAARGTERPNDFAAGLS